MNVNCLNNILKIKPEKSIESRPVMMPERYSKDRLEVERKTKLIRILTVVGYVCSVSVAAAMLSLYYVFIWDPAISHQTNATRALVHYTPNHTQDHAGKNNTITTTAPLLQTLIDKCCFQGLYMYILMTIGTKVNFDFFLLS